MKINKVSNVNIISKRENIQAKKVNTSSKENNSQAAVFEKSKPQDLGHVYDKSAINQLKMEAQKSYDALKKMIETMLGKQGKTLNLLDPTDMVEIDQSTRAEAQALIGPDGPLGVEAVSDQIVDFAKAISGGDKSKLDTLKNAIIKGFNEAERILGGLPEISRNTYDRIMEKLDHWANEES